MTGAQLSVTVDGRDRRVPPDVSVAAALLAGDGPGVPMFCGMGSCHACTITVDGVRGVRACITAVRAGMAIETGTVSGQ